MSQEEVVNKIVEILEQDYQVPRSLAITVVNNNPHILQKAIESGSQSFYAAAMLLNWNYDDQKSTLYNFG